MRKRMIARKNSKKYMNMNDLMYFLYYADKYGRWEAVEEVKRWGFDLRKAGGGE